MVIYTYKPGFACSFDGGMFHLWAVLPDAYGGEERVITYTLGGDGSPQSFREFIRRFEMHEVDEWCMVLERGTLTGTTPKKSIIDR